MEVVEIPNERFVFNVVAWQNLCILLPGRHGICCVVSLLCFKLSLFFSFHLSWQSGVEKVVIFMLFYFSFADQANQTMDYQTVVDDLRSKEREMRELREEFTKKVSLSF